MRPLVERLKSAYAGKVEFREYRDGGDSAGNAIAAQFNVLYVPSFLFVNADGTVSGSLLVGEADEAGLRARIDALK
jgi:hypothetical protein